MLDISDEFTSDEKQKIKEHLFKHIHQNSLEDEKKKENEKKNDIDSSNEKVLLPYIQYLQNISLPSKKI